MVMAMAYYIDSNNFTLQLLSVVNFLFSKLKKKKYVEGRTKNVLLFKWPIWDIFNQACIKLLM